MTTKLTIVTEVNQKTNHLFSEFCADIQEHYCWSDFTLRTATTLDRHGELMDSGIRATYLGWLICKNTTERN